MNLLDRDPVASGRLSDLNLELGSERHGVSPATSLEPTLPKAAAS
jgi:hypothetical protein